MTPKTLEITLITALCALFFMRAVPAEVVNIPDTNLRAAIHRTLDKPTDALIEASEMLNLTKLNAEDIGISDLTGLEYAANLVEL